MRCVNTSTCLHGHETFSFCIYPYVNESKAITKGPLTADDKLIQKSPEKSRYVGDLCASIAKGYMIKSELKVIRTEINNLDVG
jgi:hypothetical protein